MACPVCYSAADPVVRESLNAGIGVLLVVTGVVLAGFGRFIVSLMRRARTASIPIEARHLGGAPAPGGHDAGPLPRHAMPLEGSL